MGLLFNYKVAGMMWWEEDRLLTEKDKEAIEKAKKQSWTKIDEDSAETLIGKRRLHSIAMRKFHYEEFQAGLL